MEGCNPMLLLAIIGLSISHFYAHDEWDKYWYKVASYIPKSPFLFGTNFCAHLL